MIVVVLRGFIVWFTVVTSSVALCNSCFNSLLGFAVCLVRLMFLCS